MPCDSNEKRDRELEQLLAGPIYKAVGVARSGVGADPATNLPLDVALVQSLLNRIPKPKTAAKSTAPLPVNGKCDRVMVERIKAFQAGFLKQADGRIDPHGKTWRKLVDASGERPNKDNKKRLTFGAKPEFVRAHVDRARLKEMTKRHLGLQNRNERMTDFLKLLFADPTVTRLQWLAYYLATAYHETTFTFKPVREAGKGSNRGYGKKVVSVTDTHGYRGPKGKVYKNVYYGWGFVQLTNEAAYKNFPHQVIGLREDELYIDPDQALEFETAYKILTYWMQNKVPMVKGEIDTLQYHTSGEVLKYKEARAIVNANDCAVRIANYARVFELLILSTRR